MRPNEITEVRDPWEVQENKRRSPTGKIIVIIVVIALLAGLVYGIAAGLQKGIAGCSGLYQRNTVPFSEMEYARPSKNEVFGRIDDAVKSVTADEDSYGDQLELVRQYIESDYSIYTMYTLAMIRNSIDTTDEFYADEMSFYADFMPLYYQKEEELYVACAQSEYMDRFEDDCFSEGFLEVYKEGVTMTDESVELTQYTEELSNEYLMEAAVPTVEWQGETVSVYELLSDPNLTGEEYYALLRAYYDKYNPVFGEMYVDIVKSNMLLAEEYGYDSYIDYVYDYYARDYTPEDAERFMEGVKEYFVPLFLRLNNDGYYEDQYTGFARSDSELLGDLESVTGKMGGEIARIYNFMEKYGLYDFTATEVKEPMSYTTYLYDYDAPFIVVDPAGDDTDILTVIHEFGHFVDNYINYGYDSGLDCSETASQSMEYLALSYLDGTLNTSERELVYTKKLLDSVDVFIYQGYYNELETRVYSLDYNDVTLGNINRIAGECAAEFGLKDFEPWEGYYNESWVDVPHLYDSPFYVISYCTSCDAALQIYELSVNGTAKEAVDTYYDLVDWDWSMAFIDNLERVGLESPFASGRTEKTAELIEKYFYD
jgi:oligoendopeptidase F